MTILYFMGTNSANISKVSWKLWKIERKGREVTVWWGPATIVKRKVKPANTLQSKAWRFRTEDAAKQDQARRIKEKLNKGYERKPRRALA